MSLKTNICRLFYVYVDDFMRIYFMYMYMQIILLLIFELGQRPLLKKTRFSINRDFRTLEKRAVSVALSLCSTKQPSPYLFYYINTLQRKVMKKNLENIKIRKENGKFHSIFDGALRFFSWIKNSGALRFLQMQIIWSPPFFVDADNLEPLRFLQMQIIWSPPFFVDADNLEPSVFCRCR